MDKNPYVREQVRQVVKEKLLLKGDNAGFMDSDSLLVSRRLDSTDSIELILLLEEQFNIHFESSGFDQVMIDSVDSIVKLIENGGAQAL